MGFWEEPKWMNGRNGISAEWKTEYFCNKKEEISAEWKTEYFCNKKGYLQSGKINIFVFKKEYQQRAN
jgi:hypothetical protein